MKNLIFLFTGLAFASVLLASNADTHQADISISKTKDRIQAASQYKKS